MTDFVTEWGKKKQAPIAPADRLRCLVCSAPGPFASCVVLRSFALRDGKLISEPTHERVCCQRCGAQFTFGPDGAFHHHPQAEPYTGSAAPGRESMPSPEAPDRPDKNPPHAPWPEALQRPKV